MIPLKNSNVGSSAVQQPLNSSGVLAPTNVLTNAQAHQQMMLLNNSQLSESSALSQQQMLNLSSVSQQQPQKKANSKPRVNGGGPQQMTASIQQLQRGSNEASAAQVIAVASSMIQTQNVGMPSQHNQTVKLPQNYLTNAQAGVNSNYHSQQSAKGDKNAQAALSASQKKRISIKKQCEEECSKTIEQLCSPNSSTLNLENMKKTQSLHYVRATVSGTSSPQQLKSRTSIGKYQPQNPSSVLGMAMYNNYNNQLISATQQQPRNSFLSKSQIGGPNGIVGVNASQQMPVSMPASATTGLAMPSGSRSRSKTTNRKKRNLYTSIGNYYQSQQQTNASSAQQQQQQQPNLSASRASKRLNQQQNYLENLEQTNFLQGGNLAAAHNFLLQEDILAKKRNKSSTKSYNNKGDLLDHNTSSEVCYSSHLSKKNPLNNNFFEVSQFSSNQNSIAKNFENSFQFSAGGFLQGGAPKPQSNTATNNLSGLVSANKQRPTSSHKSALLAAASALSSAKQAQQAKKKQLRKSAVNGGAGKMNSNHLNMSHQVINQNYGANHLQQNAYDFLANASLFMNTGKAARRPKGNSAVESRCSQNKDHAGALSGLVKSQISSNAAFQQVPPNLNNTSHTTICSNRKQGNPGEIMSGKKNSLQPQQMQSNYMSLAPHTSDVLTAGEISSDRQTLKMNDFLKQIEAYSNDKLDKFMPQMSQAQHLSNIIGSSSSMGHNAPGGNSAMNNYNVLTQQAKIAEQIRTLIDREMSVMNQTRSSASKPRYQQHNDESNGGQNPDGDDLEDSGIDDEDPQETPNIQGPDFEHLLNMLSDSFHKMICTFYNSSQASTLIGQSLAKIKASYEEIINSIVENLSQQIESLSLENEQFLQENLMLKERNTALESQAENFERSTHQVTNFAKQNEALEKKLNKLNEENNVLKKEQRDRDYQLIESKKMIEKLSVSQKQLMTQGSNLNHHNSQGSSKTAARQGPGESSMIIYNQQSSKGAGKGVPPLDLGRLKQVTAPQQVQQQVQPLMSNDSLDTLNKGLINANLPDCDMPSAQSSAFINTVPNHDGNRMLEELYQPNYVGGGKNPFMANQSDISYQNSDQEEYEQQAADEPDTEAAYLNNHGSTNIDKSPLQKPVPFIPPLNLAGLNNRQQAALQNQQQVQLVPQQPIPAGKPQMPKFKLDLGSMQNSQQTNQLQQQQDQDLSSNDYQFKQQHQQQPQRPTASLGINLGALKQQKGILDFQDEFVSKVDEFSESWRDALRREKRF